MIRFALAVLCIGYALHAQTATRDIVLKTFREERPAPAATTAVNAPAHPVARRPTPMNAIVGVTLWHMRPASNSDQVKVRGFVHDEPSAPDENTDYTPERVAMGTPVSPSEYFRLSFESARSGYLYVINRDIYADGATSPATLIFPTLHLRGGDNAVSPGRTIEIPAFDDKPPVFRLKKTRPDQTSVRLTVIVAPQPIPDLRPSRDQQPVTDSQLAEWEKRWGARTTEITNPDLAGKAYTRAEQTAAGPNARPLSPNDPLPTTLIECHSRPGEPMLGSVTLKLE